MSYGKTGAKFKGHRPTKQTIEDIVQWLSDEGLTVYGPAIDLNTGDRVGSCMDYDADAIVRARDLARLKDNHEL